MERPFIGRAKNRSKVRKKMIRSDSARGIAPLPVIETTIRLEPVEWELGSLSKGGPEKPIQRKKKRAWRQSIEANPSLCTPSKDAAANQLK